jgi:hypothetical protein
MIGTFICLRSRVVQEQNSENSTLVERYMDGKLSIMGIGHGEKRGIGW